MNAPLPALLRPNLLVIDQVTGWVSNDFAIKDDAGVVLGVIRTEGGLGARLLMGSRRFTVTDAETGAVVLRINDTMNLGRDRYELTDAGDVPLASVVKRISFLVTKVSVEMADGTQLALKGNLFDYDFVIEGPHGPCAQVSRSWAGLAAGLLGHSRYVLSLADIPPAMRATVIGTVVALDLIRAKQKKSAAASSS